MGDRLILLAEELNNSESHPSESSSPNEVDTSQRMNSSMRGVHQYEGLMGDSLPCPSCSGSGRIPKDQERELIALIPANDSRLKPRRTWLYVMLTVSACLLISGLLFFFLLPRSVSVDPLSGPITQTNFIQHTSESLIVMSFLAPVQVDNFNYYSVRVLNATGQVYSQQDPFNRKLIGEGLNASQVMIPLRSESNLVFINYTTKLTADEGATWCDFWIKSLRHVYVNLDFEVQLTLQYMGHTESSAVQKFSRQVCCGNNGNCTESEAESAFTVLG